MNPTTIIYFTCSICLLLFGTTTSALASPNSRKVSIVTGANGYLGREIVHNLLGYRIPIDNSDDKIICLVRQRRVEEEKRYWKSIAQKIPSPHGCEVKVMAYDMLDGGETLLNALNHAFKDCSSAVIGDDADTDVDVDTECCVYHLASVFSPVDDHRQMALDNVKGAEDVIKAVAKLPSRKTKVVFTSSMAAVRGSGQTPRNGKWYTHEDWNTVSELGANWGSSYQWSKAESEKRSWELANKHSIPFVALCPSFIFGPPADGTQSNSYSLTIVRSWIRGDSSVQSRLCVDVRDVARAHVLAGNAHTVLGQRVILSREARIPSQDLADELKRIAKETGVGDPDAISYDADFDGGAIVIGEREVECVERANTLLGGLEFRSPKETLADMAIALLEMER